MTDHSPKIARNFNSVTTARLRIILAWTLTGKADYLLQVWCADLPKLNHSICDLPLLRPALARLQRQITLDKFQADTALPT